MLRVKAYRCVVFALVDSRIDIFECDGVDHTLDPGVGASYSGNPESIIIHPHLDAHTALNRRALVHEATHAVQDDHLNGEWVWRLDDEATAYIAEWLFVIYCSPNTHHLRNKPGPKRSDRSYCLRNRSSARRQSRRVARRGSNAAPGGCDLQRPDLFGRHVAAPLDPRRRRHCAGFPLEAAPGLPLAQRSRFTPEPRASSA